MTVEIVSGERVTGPRVLPSSSATDHLRTAGEQVTRSCAISAARYFLDRPEPVMYVVYDAQAEVAYWLWVQPYLRNLDARRPGWRDRKTVAIRLPIAIGLTADSAPAIAEHVRAWWRRMLAAAAPPTPSSRALPDLWARGRAAIPRRRAGARLPDGDHRSDRHGRHRGHRAGQAGGPRAPPGAFATASCGPTAAARPSPSLPTCGPPPTAGDSPGDDPDAKAAPWRSLIAGEEGAASSNVQAGQKSSRCSPPRAAARC